MMRIPGIQPARIQSPVQSIDVMPTIFAALHLKPPYSFQGENLVPVLTGKKEIPKNRLIISESPQWIRLRRDNWAGIFTKKGNPSQIYDLKIDPEEATNLALKRAGVSRRLWNAYLDTIKIQTDIAAQFQVQPGSKSEIPEEVKEQLKALGYIAE